MPKGIIDSGSSLLLDQSSWCFNAMAEENKNTKIKKQKKSRYDTYSE